VAPLKTPTQIQIDTSIATKVPLARSACYVSLLNIAGQPLFSSKAGKLWDVSTLHRKANRSDFAEDR
jgi:hypothetical protein